MSEKIYVTIEMDQDAPVSELVSLPGTIKSVVDQEQYNTYLWETGQLGVDEQFVEVGEDPDVSIPKFKYGTWCYKDPDSLPVEFLDDFHDFDIFNVIYEDGTIVFKTPAVAVLWHNVQWYARTYDQDDIICIRDVKSPNWANYVIAADCFADPFFVSDLNYSLFIKAPEIYNGLKGTRRILK